MIVYIEDCLIENTLLTYLLLLCLNKIFGIKESKTKHFLVSLLAGVFAIFYPIVPLNGAFNIAFKLCVGVIIVYLYSKQNMLAKYITFMLLTAMYAGVNMLVYYFIYNTINIKNNFPTYVLIAMLYLIYYIINSCVKLLKKNLTISNFVYQIKIEDNQKIIYDTAFLDSGNTLLDDKTQMPIYIVNFNLFSRLYDNITIQDILTKNYKNLKQPHYVKSGYASGGGKLLVFTIDKIEIFSNSKNIEMYNAKVGVVYSKFHKNFNCNMLLNINIFAN